MSIAELQLRLHAAIDAITDEGKLDAIYQLLKGGSKGPHQPLSQEQYVQAINESRQQIRDGNFQTVEDLERESEGW